MFRHIFKVIPKQANLMPKVNVSSLISMPASTFSTQKGNKQPKQDLSANDRESKSNRNDEYESNPPSSKLDIFKKIAFLMCAGVIGGFLGYVVFGQEEEQAAKAQRQQAKPQEKTTQEMKLGGEWKLISTQGKPFTSKDLAGTYYLIYFGYALCPDICPTTLNYLSNVNRHLKNLEEGKEINLRIVFVSVDPKRDSPQSIKSYVSLFDSNIIGLTGKDENDEDFKQMLKSFKVYANKIKNQEGNSYNIDHTSIVFLMDPKSQYVGSINPSKSQKQTAHFLIDKIKHYRTQATSQAKRQ